MPNTPGCAVWIRIIRELSPPASALTELDPHDVHALNELGQLYEAINRQDRALDMYERSLEFQPHQADVGVRVSRLKAQGVGLPHPD